MIDKSTCTKYKIKLKRCNEYFAHWNHLLKPIKSISKFLLFESFIFMRIQLIFSISTESVFFWLFHFSFSSQYCCCWCCGYDKKTIEGHWPSHLLLVLFVLACFLLRFRFLFSPFFLCWKRGANRMPYFIVCNDCIIHIQFNETEVRILVFLMRYKNRWKECSNIERSTLTNYTNSAQNSFCLRQIKSESDFSNFLNWFLFKLKAIMNLCIFNFFKTKTNKINFVFCFFFFSSFDAQFCAK